MDMDKFAAFIAERRRELGLTQQELAKRLKVTDKAVSRWENGHGFPDINTLEPLAEALGISVVELMKSEAVKNGAISPEVADSALSDAMEMAGKQTRTKTILTVFAVVLAVIIIVPLALQIWGYNNPEITVGFGQPVGDFILEDGQNMTEAVLSGQGREENGWIAVGPVVSHHFYSPPISGCSERSVFGMSKTWKLRLMQWQLLGDAYYNQVLLHNDDKPYVFLARLDVIDGKTWYTRLGYYTENGAAKPFYDVSILDFKFKEYKNLPDSIFSFVWSEFPELKEAYEQKLTTAEWEERQNLRS